MAHSFSLQLQPARVVFGRGVRARVAEEAASLGMTRPLIISAGDRGGHAEALGYGLPGAARFSGARMHTPVEVTELALRRLDETGADGLIALGGGSAIGLSKALALRTDLPQIVLPVTYAGSEMTPILGETSAGQKRTQSSPRILPETVIYDVELTTEVRPQVAALSGMNAIAHAVEALYARDRNPLVSTLAIAGVGALAGALPAIMRDGEALGPRTEALTGAWFCGLSLSAVGMSLHHKLCHVLGGLFDLPHAALHAALLPHAAAYNEVVEGEALAPVAKMLEATRAADGLYRLAKGLGAEMSLARLGMPADGVEAAVSAALANPYWNPRPLTEAGVRTLIGDALAGAPPRPCP